MQRTLPTEMQNTSNAVLDSLVQTKSTTGCEKGIDIVKKKQSWWNRKLWHGWRKGVTISVICNIVALVFNSSLLLWAIYQRNPSPDGWILWQGSHDTLNLIDTLSHLAINIVSTAILAGSNYTLQILLAPTRKNIDRAHRKKHFLDIGISSLHNWRYLPWQWRLLYSSLFITALPIHLLYNSIIASTVASFNIDPTGVVTKDFFHVPPSNSSLKNIWSSASSFSESNPSQSNWTKLATDECVDRFTPRTVYDYANVLFFTNLTAASQNSSWYYAPYSNPATCDPYNVSLNGSQVSKTIFSPPGSWLASLDLDLSTIIGVSLTERIKDLATGRLATEDSAIEEVMTKDSTRSYDYKCVLCTSSSVSGLLVPHRNSPYIQASIDYCLVEKTYLSKIELIPQLLIILILCNVAKIIALSILVLSNFDPLVTIGDAIASFLDTPDSTTRHVGLISALTLPTQNSGTVLEWPSSRLIAHDGAWKAQPHHYSDTVTRARWRWTLSLCSMYLLAIVVVGIWTLPQYRVQNTQGGFGTVMWGAFVRSSHTSLIGSILLVNAPQLALSSMYLTYNALFTCVLLSKEWLNYCKHKKSLRVTHPQGEQRSAHFLSLPYRYSIPLAATATLLHWLLSQTLFGIRIDMYKSDLTPEPSQNDHSVGISQTGLIVSAVLLGILIIAPILLSVKQLDAAMPLVRSNSLAISAACHSAVPTDERLSLKKLQYGVISRASSGKYHVGFSDGEVRPLVSGEFYE